VPAVVEGVQPVAQASALARQVLLVVVQGFPLAQRELLEEAREHVEGPVLVLFAPAEALVLEVVRQGRHEVAQVLRFPIRHFAIVLPFLNQVKPYLLGKRAD
jgi:hypothetical protein